MTDTEAELLLLIERETDRVERLSPYRDINSHDVSEWVSRSSAVRALKAGLGIKVDSAWVGHDATARQARRRALNRLRELGLIELHSATGLRVTHVRIVGRPIPQPARPAPPPPVEHRPTAAELRHARLVAWSAECRAKETAEVSQLFAESDAWVDRTLSELAEGETLSSLREQLQADGSEPRE